MGQRSKRTWAGTKIESRKSGVPEGARTASFGREPEGDWRVERLGGILPPMPGVWKRIRGSGGETCVGPLPAWPFRVERRGERVALVYRPPFSGFVDELRAGTDGAWNGRATLGGRELGRFRMVRIGKKSRANDREEEKKVEPNRMKSKLVEYVQNVHAMEQNILLRRYSIILTTDDTDFTASFRAHKADTRRHERRLNDWLKA